MLVEDTPSLRALMKCAIMLLFFTLSVSLSAQTFNSSTSYRVDGRVQSSYSAKQAVSSSGSFGTSQWQSTSHTYRQASYIGTTTAEPTQYRSYSSTVYQPFTTGTPSDDGSSGSDGDDWSGGDVDLGDWGDEPDIADPGNQSSESPVGEPFILLLFAAVAAVVMGVRNRKLRTKSDQ